MEKEKLSIAVKESVNYSEVCKLLYGNNNYGNRITIKKYIELFDINIKHFTFTSRSESFSRNFKKTKTEDILIKDSTFDTTKLKGRLYKEGLKLRECELCGQGEEWKGKKMSLILDHINGINNDNRLKNLRIVCPNCNATLSTHGGKNIKLKSTIKPKYGRYIKKTKQEKFENQIKKSINDRKVERPCYEVLLLDIKMFGYTGTGEKYGVSDNAIRKWKKFYEKYENK